MNEFQEVSQSGADADGSRWTAVALWTAGLLALAASGLLWLRFGPQVFLDAALAAWRSCF